VPSEDLYRTVRVIRRFEERALALVKAEDLPRFLWTVRQGLLGADSIMGVPPPRQPLLSDPKHPTEVEGTRPGHYGG